MNTVLYTTTKLPAICYNTVLYCTVQLLKYCISYLINLLCAAYIMYTTSATVFLNTRVLLVKNVLRPYNKKIGDLRRVT